MKWKSQIIKFKFFLLFYSMVDLKVGKEIVLNKHYLRYFCEELKKRLREY